MWYRPLMLEQEFQRIITQQELDGIWFDMQRAWEHVDYLVHHINDIWNRILPHLNRRVVVPYDKPISKPFLKAGGYTRSAVNWWGDSVDVVGGPHSRVLFEYPNPSSNDQIKEQLFKFGWKPDTWNYKKDKQGKLVKDEKGDLIKTSPKLTESSYKTIEHGVGPDIADYLVHMHRLRTIVGYIDRVRDDGRITPGVITPGTPTARVRHVGVANVPAVDAVYGKEMRELFGAPEGRVMVGYDAGQLEARVGGHWTYKYDDGDYAKQVIDGDWHSFNARYVYFPKESEEFSSDKDKGFVKLRQQGKSGSYCIT